MFKTCFTIIGTFIGAGFVSGQEIYLFFNTYGNIGIVGLLIASAVISLIVYQSYNFIEKYKVSNVFSVVKNNKIKKIAIIVTNIFLVIIFFIMIAGTGAYLEQEWNINKTIGNIFICILCFATFRYGIKRNNYY